MKLLLMLLFLLLCGSYTVLCQSILKKKVTIDQSAGTVGELLKELNKIPDVSLNYSSGVVSLAKRIELSGKETTVEEYLLSILKGQPVKYVEQNGKIFLIFDENSPFKKKIYN